MLSHPLKRPPAIDVPADHGDFRIRSFRSSDRDDVLQLYHHGVLGDRPSAGEKPADLADIEKSYFQRPQDHLWVAEAEGSMIGTVALLEDSQRVMHLRRLRVASPWQPDGRVATGLVRTAVAHARLHSCLKLVFHTSLGSLKAMALLDGLGLQLSRVRSDAGQLLFEFYEDVYAAASRAASSGATDQPPLPH